MPYITSVERIGIEKGIAQGIEQGLEQGMQQGRQLGSAAMLLRLIERRFGPVDEARRARIEGAEPEVLLCWSERILGAATLDEVLR